MNDRPSPDLNAAMVLGMASTAIPFARSPEAEAERWLRILRLHGHAGAALQALGVSEAPLEGGEHGEPAGAGAAAAEDVVARVGELACASARERGADCFGSIDVLLAVIDVYGEYFDRVLRAHGTDREEVIERLQLLAA